MANNRQRREAAKRKLQHQNERRQKQSKAMRQRLTVVGVVAAVVVIAGAVWFVTTLGSDSDTAAGDTTKAPAVSATGDAGASSADSPDASDTASPNESPDADKYGDSNSEGAESTKSTTDSDAAGGDCAYPAAGSAAKPVDAPTDLSPATTGTVDAAVTLNTGDVTFELDRATAPCAVNSFVSLAQQHYFDDTTCHRLTTAATLKVLQCGDPTGTGTGGPGYSFADELSGDETYQAGTLAMANAGPDTNGSQFFIVYGDSQLPPQYDMLGTVSQGLDVVQAIADKGVDGGGQDGAPADPVAIESVTVS